MICENSRQSKLVVKRNMIKKTYCYCYSLWLVPFLVLALLVLLAPVQQVNSAGASSGVKGILTIEPVSGPPGTIITITGSGYTPDGTYKLFRDTTLLTTDDVDATGAFTATYTMPLLPAAAYKFAATTLTGDTTETAAIFTVTPLITTGSSSGKAGDVITITGRGFQKSGAVAIYFDTSNAPIISPPADATGTFNSSFIVPETYQGLHSLMGKDTINYTSRLDFNVNPSIKVAEINTSTDSQITVSGSGFSGSSTISFYIDNVKIDALTSTNAAGSFIGVKITIPTISGGIHNLKAQDSKGFYDLSSITVTSSITLSPSEGSAGTQIRIEGGGFIANAQILISYQDRRVTTVPSLIRSDYSGNFTASILAPVSPSGTFIISATDGTNNGSANFILNASALLAQTNGSVGNEILIRGNGFKAGAALNIKFDNIAIASVSVGTDGSFNGSIIVPAALPGPHKVIVTDGLNPIVLTFFIEAYAQISTPKGTSSQTLGNVGGPVTVKGNGLTPGSTVNITYDSEPVGFATVDATGCFSADFDAPPSESGNHIVVASDGINQFSFIFVMEATPPPSPMCLAPMNDTKSSAQTRFQWVGVSDPSGVTYRLQLSQFPNFKPLIMDKIGLTESGYLLTAEEKLQASSQKQPYYWRVQAIDNASNASPWSEASTFYVGFIVPPAVLYTFFGLVGLLIFGGGFVIGTRWGGKFKLFSRHQPEAIEATGETEEAAAS